MQTIFVIMQKIKSSVLIVCNRVPYPLKDGGALAMYAMIKGWHELGKSVHVVCMNTSRHSVDATMLPPLFGAISSFTMFAMNTDIKAHKVIQNLLFSQHPEHADRFYNKHFGQLLVDTIQKTQPDIIQLESIYLATYVPAIRACSKAKIIQRLHNIEAEVWHRLAKETKHPLKRWYLFNLAKRIAQFEQKAWQDCDALLPISEVDTQKIKALGIQQPICTLPYGIEINEHKQTNEPILSLNKAYHIGAMDWQPNIDAMEWMCSDIMPAVAKALTDFTFYFAGRNMPQHLLSLKQANIVCMGEVANADAFIADKSILVVPLRSGSGIRVKTLEAMAAQKLVISTAIGIQGIAAIAGTHFIQANNSQDFVTALVWAHEHPDEAKKIAAAGASLIRSHYQQNQLMQTCQSFVENLS